MGEQLTILLIEDEVGLLHNLQILLQSEGYRVVTAANGVEGIHKVEEQAIDLVITDIVMPEMDGFQVMEYVQDHCPDTVVVAITAYASTESAIQALRRGAYDYLAKPFDVDLLQIVIKRALEKARLQKALRHYMTELEQKVEARTHKLTQAKEQLEESLAELKAAQEQLIHTATLRAMGEATTAVAHELADPLTIIVSLAQTLAKDVPSEGRMKAQLTQISEAAFCCHRLVQSRLNFLDAKASIDAMTGHINLGHMRQRGRSGEVGHRSVPNRR
jgi:YesN/AraC family two-component response regulator